jgi:hypothetical protein
MKGRIEQQEMHQMAKTLEKFDAFSQILPNPA